MYVRVYVRACVCVRVRACVCNNFPFALSPQTECASPEVCEEVGQRLFVVVQVGGGHEEALDDDPGLLPVVGISAAGLEGVECDGDGLLRGQTDRRLTVLEVHQDPRPTRLTVIVVQLQQT